MPDRIDASRDAVLAALARRRAIEEAQRLAAEEAARQAAAEQARLRSQRDEFVPAAAAPAVTRADAASPSTPAPSADQQRVDEASRAFADSVDGESPLDATRKLKETLEQLPPNLRGDFLAQSAQSLERLVDNITELDGDATKEAVAELSRAADVAGPAHVEELTRPLARAIADGRLEQTGDDANGGPLGVFEGSNTHHSEREFIDGVAALGGGQNLFKDSLAASLSAESHASTGDRADRALGFAGAVVTGDSGQVPDDGFWTGVRELGGDVVGLVEDAVERVNDLREGVADRALDSLLGITESLESLKPGDTLTIGGKAKVSAEVHAQAEGELEVTRNDDGTYTVKGSAKALAGVGAADDHLAVGAGGTVEFKFDNLQQAIDGTQALSKIALSTQLPVIAGLAAPSPDELRALGEHVSAVELSAEASAELDGRFGLSGVQGGGAEGELTGSSGVRIEFENGRPSAVVTKYELGAEGAAEASNLLQRFGPEELRDLQGTAEAEGKATVEVRTPISGVSLPELLENPDGARIGTPTVSAKLTGEAQVNGHGVEGTVEIEGIDPSKAGTVIERLKNGDFEGALAATGATHTFSYRTFEEDERGWVNHELDIAVASVEGQNVVRHYDETHETVVRPNADGTGLEVG